MGQEGVSWDQTLNDNDNYFLSIFFFKGVIVLYLKKKKLTKNNSRRKKTNFLHGNMVLD